MHTNTTVDVPTHPTPNITGDAGRIRSFNIKLQASIKPAAINIKIVFRTCILMYAIPLLSKVESSVFALQIFPSAIKRN